MRSEVGVITGGLRRILERGGVDAQVARGAAVHTLEACEHYLVNLERCGQDGAFCGGVRFVLGLKLKEVSLIGLPRWCVGLPLRRENKGQREDAESEEGLLESAFHYSTPPVTCTHGGTNAQPGPRKKVPTTIRTTLATTNGVKSQRISLRSAGRRLGFLSRYGIRSSASTIRAGATTPPSRAEWLTNSCNTRKYQGALAGLGVFAGLASCSRGALSNSDITMTVVTVPIKTTASRTNA